MNLKLKMSKFMWQILDNSKKDLKNRWIACMHCFDFGQLSFLLRIQDQENLLCPPSTFTLVHVCASMCLQWTKPLISLVLDDKVFLDILEIFSGCLYT